MNVLIVKKIKEDIHGTVILAQRLFTHFNKHNITCYLTKYNSSSLIETYPFQEKIIPVNEWRLQKNASTYRKIHADIIFCLTTTDAVTGYQLQQKFFPSAKLLIGVYHPRQFFCPTYLVPNYAEILHKKMAGKIDPSCLIFMDEICRKTHEEYYTKNYKNSPVVPLPMNIAGRILSPAVIRSKIVSVGRLTMFKTYPFGVLHAMVHLQKTMNISLTYHIAGDGPLLDSIKEMVSKLGLENSVVFHGKIPYSSVNELIQDACCFIGTGTAVGEAAGIGVPALVAIAYDAGHTYGLLGNLPPNILGESGEDLPLISFSDALSHIYQLPSGVYEEERRKSAEKAGFYDVKNVAKLLVKAFEAAVPGIPLKINLLQRIMYYIARVQIRLFSKRGYKFK